MSAQETWKSFYFDYKLALKYATGSQQDWRMDMWRVRREAALERKLEAAQRTIETQEQRIGKLESMLILYMGLPTGPAGYTSWPVAPLHDQARNVINR